MAYVRKIKFDCRKLVVQRIAKIKGRGCYLEMFEYLVKNKVDYTANRNGVLFSEITISRHGV